MSGEGEVLTALPEGVIVEVETVAARVDPFDWPWAARNGDAIARNWERRRRLTPALFNGRVLMVRGARIEAGALHLRFFATDYANMLGHMDLGSPDPAVANGFAMGALRSRDGAYLIGEMAAHTANAGRLYFPAGTPDLQDLRPDGVVDLAASLMRELGEETGLGPELCSFEGPWAILSLDRRHAIMRQVRVDLDAQEAAAAIRRHIASDPKAELAAIHVARGLDDLDGARMPSFLPVYLRWAFARASDLQR